ncbi:MAG: hypothetical protein ACI4KF_07425 [Huintestinicola sp.]
MEAEKKSSNHLAESLKKYTDKLRHFTESRYAMPTAICVGVLGMLMILFSGGAEDEGKKNTEEKGSVSQFADYRQETEQRLEKILSAIDGVGDVSVMVTVSSSEEYIYAEALEKSGEDEERSLVIVKNGSKEEGIVKKVKYPIITGVVVVCEGGSSGMVCEKVYYAVSKALSIPSSRIYVAPAE